jgi:hypothetical protein
MLYKQLLQVTGVYTFGTVHNHNGLTAVNLLGIQVQLVYKVLLGLKVQQVLLVLKEKVVQKEIMVSKV